MTPSPTLTLVIGGARSGKSRHAEALVEAMPAPWTYLATATALDAEMAGRVALHQARRDGRWRTVEAPLDVAAALDGTTGPVLLDCLTLWLTNVMLGERDVAAEVERLERALAARRHPVVIVSNEVGLGIVPENALARRFRDEQGRLNQRMAALVDRVVFLVAGLPMVVK
jgi:adenosylcobinamide kinase / adenosylcobinamide-phosphate guanylyltransferase